MIWGDTKGETVTKLRGESGLVVRVGLGYRLTCTVQHFDEPIHHSSSPKNTCTGNHESPQTLKRSGIPSILATSSSVRSQPSRSKLALTRSGLMLFGSTLQPFFKPHIRITCWTLRFLAFAMAAIASFLYRGESPLPRGE